MIKNVMLIDDNRLDLFINQKIVEKYEPAVNTKIFNNAISAICFFKLLELNVTIKSAALPDIILLDINMPQMDGFDFFDEFKQLDLIKRKNIKVYIVSSSVCPLDLVKAQNEAYCSGYITKPLTVDKLNDILNKSVGMDYYPKLKKII